MCSGSTFWHQSQWKPFPSNTSDNYVTINNNQAPTAPRGFRYIPLPRPARFIVLSSATTAVFTTVSVTMAFLPGLRPEKVPIVSQMIRCRHQPQIDFTLRSSRTQARQEHLPHSAAGLSPLNVKKHWPEKQYVLFPTHLQIYLSVSSIIHLMGEICKWRLKDADAAELPPRIPFFPRLPTKPRKSLKFSQKSKKDTCMLIF